MRNQSMSQDRTSLVPFMRYVAVEAGTHSCSPLRICVRPTLISDPEGDTVAIGVFADAASKDPMVWAYPSSPDADGEIHIDLAPERLANWYETQDDDLTWCASHSDVLRAMIMQIQCLHPFEGEDDYDRTSMFEIMMCACLPPSYPADTNWNPIPATVLRDVCNALQLNPSSIKKEDVAAALAACRKSYDSDFSEIIPAIVSTYNDTSAEILVGPVIMQNEYDGNCRRSGASRRKIRYGLVYEAHGHTFNNNFIPADNGFAFVTTTKSTSRYCDDLWLTLSAHGRQAINKLANSGMPVGEIGNWTTALIADRFTHSQVASSLRDDAKQLSEIIKKNEEKIAQMLSAIKISEPVQLPEAAGTTMIMGEDFPFYASPDAPPAVPNYSISYWSASQRLGSGSKTVKFDATDFIDAMLHDMVVSLVGPPGTGKTTIVQQSCHLLGIPCSIVQFTRDKPIEQLIGVDKIRAGSQVFVDGEITVGLRRAANNPDIPYVIVFDEFDHAPSEVQSDFHGVVEGRDYTLPSGEIIKNHGNIRFVLTRNTTGHGDSSGRHASANVSDSAFNSRIKSAFMVDYMNSTDEAMLLSVHGLDSSEAEQLVTFANSTRDSVSKMDSGETYDGMTEPVCLRHLLAYASCRKRGVKMSKALAQCIVSQLPERDRSVANELAIAHMSFED